MKPSKLILLVLLFVFSEVFPQELKGFLYGKVTLKNDQSYIGQLRLENEAGAWDDLLESYKNEPQIQEQINIQGYEKNNDNSNEVFEFNFMKLWENKDSKSRFAFKCQFGHIDRIIDFKDSKSATVVFKNGKKIKLRRRGNDIGDDVFLFHKDLGKLEFDWDDIKEINFYSAPGNLRNVNGAKLFGKVLTIDGPLNGYIVWDYDEEAYEKDIINGYQQKVEYDIEFGKIKSLRPEREGSILTFQKGTDLFLRSSSDVNKDNDGIFIKTEKLGMIDVDWSNLIRIDFVKPEYKSKDYEDYHAPNALYGKVETIDGQSIKGRLIYDLDEAWDIEILDGMSKGTKYYLPFYLIERITPQNYNYSLVELTDDTSLLLGEEGDVNHKNNGILVWLSESKTKYVPWKKIKSVTFTPK